MKAPKAPRCRPEAVAEKHLRRQALVFFRLRAGGLGGGLSPPQKFFFMEGLKRASWCILDYFLDKKVVEIK